MGYKLFSFAKLSRMKRDVYMYVLEQVLYSLNTNSNVVFVLTAFSLDTQRANEVCHRLEPPYSSCTRMGENAKCHQVRTVHDNADGFGYELIAEDRYTKVPLACVTFSSCGALRATFSGMFISSSSPVKIYDRNLPACFVNARTVSFPKQPPLMTMANDVTRGLKNLNKAVTASAAQAPLTLNTISSILEHVC